MHHPSHAQQWHSSWLPTSPHGTHSNYHWTSSTQMEPSPATGRHNLLGLQINHRYDIINCATPPLSKFPAKLPFLQATLHHLHALRPQGVTLDWTKSHPEQRTNINNYSHRDWGILLADCAASNQPLPDRVRIQVLKLITG